MTTLLQAYMQPMLEANIDYLVLGCTHYPYLIPQLLKLLPKEVKIIDSGEAVAKQTKLVLDQHNLLTKTKLKPSQLFYTNGSVRLLKELAPILVIVLGIVILVNSLYLKSVLEILVIPLEIVALVISLFSKAPFPTVIILFGSITLAIWLFLKAS